MFKTLTPSNDYIFEDSNGEVIKQKKLPKNDVFIPIDEDKEDSNESYKDDDIYAIDKLEQMRDNGRNMKDETIERLIRDDLKFESSSPEDQEDSFADCF